MPASLLGVRAPTDLLLHHLAPLGLAASRGTALVVDLDRHAPEYPGSTTVASLLGDGPGRQHLRPLRPGVAVLGHGGATADEAMDLVAALASGWPAVVVRAPEATLPWPTVPVFPAFPASWRPGGGRPVMLQEMTPLRRQGAGTLPPLRPGQVRAMLDGRVSRGWRWVKAWRVAWELQWE